MAAMVEGWRSALRVGCAQIDVIPFDILRNVETHRELIAQAREQDVSVVVFPELSLTGYSTGERGYELAMTRDDSLLRSLAVEAGDMAVVVGFIEEGYAAQFFNSAAVLRNGRVEFVHRKLNLATYGNLEEGKYFAAGRYVEPVELGEPFTGSILICADMWNPALVHLAALHGATILLSPTNSALDSVSGAFSNPRGWDVVVSFYAMIYGLPVVMANRVGREEDLVFWGGSRILGPRGEVLALASDDETTLLTADISYELIKRARFELPTVRDSNLGLVEREIGRLAAQIGVPEAYRHST